MNTPKMESKVWIGLATVVPHDENLDLGFGKKASVNILNWAFNRKDFINKVKSQLLKYGYDLNELEDVKPFDFTLEYGDNLKELANIVLVNKTLQWGTFYTFDD